MTRHSWTTGDVDTLQRMKAQFASARDIAAVIGTTEGSVYACLGELTPAASECRVCREPLHPSGIGRRPVFCSLACSHDYAWAYRENVRRDARCVMCHQPSFARGKALKYCSVRCSQRHWYLFGSGRFSVRIKESHG